MEINPRNFQADIAGLRHTIWSLDLQDGETIDLPLNRDAWKSVVAARHPRAGDIIHVRSCDNGDFHSLFVHGVGTGWLRASIIEKAALATPELPKSSPLRLRWNPGLKLHEVVREDAPNAITVIRGGKDGFAMKEDAVKWINEHLASMKVAA